MARPDEIIDALIYQLEASDVVSSDVTYLNEEVDSTGKNADVFLPVIEIQEADVTWLSEFNTDRVDIEFTDDFAEEVYRAEYELILQLDVWVADTSKWSPDEIGEDARRVLYQYESAGLSKTLVDREGNLLPEIWKFSLTDAGRPDDLSGTFSVRKWRQEIEIWAYEEYRAKKDVIQSLNEDVQSFN